jgi:hypothetical protein
MGAEKPIIKTATMNPSEISVRLQPSSSIIRGEQHGHPIKNHATQRRIVDPQDQQQPPALEFRFALSLQLFPLVGYFMIHGALLRSRASAERRILPASLRGKTSSHSQLRGTL